MKKAISIALVVLLLFTLASCRDASSSTQTTDPIQTTDTAVTDDTVAFTDLTSNAIISQLNQYADEKGYAHISNVTTKATENPGEVNYIFDWLEGTLHIQLLEANGTVHTIVAYVFPFALPGVSTMEEAIPISVGLVTIPLTVCEPDRGYEGASAWHYDMILKHADTSDKTTMTSKYSGDGWEYDFLANSTTVMLGAKLFSENSVVTEKVCSQCGKSEPDAVFTEDWKSGDPCFGCLYSSQGGGNEEKLICKQCGADCTFRGLEEDGRCEDCYNSNQTSGNNNGNSANNGNAAQQPSSCLHNYTAATCTKPQTCTKCGAINGASLGHTYSNATCTAPQKCTVCGATAGSAAGHKWQGATCAHPETCSVCNTTQGDALGHNMGLTKCSRCDYTDYSAVAKSYPYITAYDSKTGEDLVVTDVSVSSSGVLSFTFNGKNYSVTIKERTYDSMTYFDCYQGGSKLSDAECRIGDASYYNMLHFEWDGVDGHRLYFCTPKQ